MTIFAELLPVALELIDDLEIDVVVQERAVTQNPASGTTSILPTERVARAAVKEFEEAFEPETRRKVTTGSVIVPASYLPNGAEAGWSVFLADSTDDPATEHKITKAERIPKLGTAIAWRLEVRR